MGASGAWELGERGREGWVLSRGVVCGGAVEEVGREGGVDGQASGWRGRSRSGCGKGVLLLHSAEGKLVLLW
jgi:hypothetical protein